ncbi:MAG: glycosyltransferase family 2 protein [Candidatus Omnitrophota bacterium]
MRSENNKLVSVVIPTFNCARYIAGAVNSVLNQTYKDFEIIIIDDGSTDNTKQILSKYLKQYNGKIRYFYQENRGGTAARNKGIKEARGDYLAFFDADDLWEREKLSKSIAFMQEHNFDWVCTALKKVTMEGKVLDERLIKPDAYGYNAKTHELYDIKKGLFYFEKGLPVHTNTQVMKRECFEKVGLLDENLLICENSDLCIRFQDAGLKGGFLNEMLTVYRTHDQSVTKGSKIDGLKYLYLVAKKCAKRDGLNKTQVRKDYANILWEIAARYYLEKKWLNSCRFALLSLFYHPDISRITKIKRYLVRGSK